MQHLLNKLEAIRAGRTSNAFILADARDADMAWGIPSFGKKRGVAAQNGHVPAWRSVPEFLDEIRQVVNQGEIDILLASASMMDVLAHKERLFAQRHITPAVRMNDTTDVWCQRGAHYLESPSQPFSSAYIEEVQYGSLTAPRVAEPTVNLGLYSMTFNNDVEADLRTLKAFREFRANAERLGFRYFLEVFAPNVKETELTTEQIPDFVNDQITRTLAGVPSGGRPLFLKIPYFGPGPLEDLVAYDPSVVVGILGGAAAEPPTMPSNCWRKRKSTGRAGRFSAGRSRIPRARSRSFACCGPSWTETSRRRKRFEPITGSLRNKGSSRIARSKTIPCLPRTK